LLLPPPMVIALSKDGLRMRQFHCTLPNFGSLQTVNGSLQSTQF
jgi:hypothetical protein